MGGLPAASALDAFPGKLGVGVASRGEGESCGRGGVGVARLQRVMCLKFSIIVEIKDLVHVFKGHH